MVAHDLRLKRQARNAQWSMDLLRLSQTQRRIAHEYKRWALEYLAAGRTDRFEYYRNKSNACWQEAKLHLLRARQWRTA